MREVVRPTRMKLTLFPLVIFAIDVFIEITRGTEESRALRPTGLQVHGIESWPWFDIR